MVWCRSGSNVSTSIIHHCHYYYYVWYGNCSITLPLLSLKHTHTYTHTVLLSYLYSNNNATDRRPRPRLTTSEEDRRIRRAPTETRFTTATAIREALQLQVSVTTVRRRLHEVGIHHRVPAAKERLTAEHRAGRLAFANRHVGKGLDFWSRVVFTDEKTFNSTNHGRLRVWRENNTRCIITLLCATLTQV